MEPSLSGGSVRAVAPLGQLINERFAETEQVIEPIEDVIAGLKHVDAVIRGADFDGVERPTIDLRGLHAVGRLFRGRSDARAVDAEALGRLRQPKLHRKPKQAVERSEVVGPEGLGGETEPLHGIRVRRMREQGAVTVDLVKDVRLLEVIQLVATANERRDGKSAGREQIKELRFGDHGRDGLDAEVAGGAQTGFDLGDLRHAVARQGEALESADDLWDGAASKEAVLSLDKIKPDAVLLGGVFDSASSLATLEAYALSKPIDERIMINGGDFLPMMPL